MRAYSETRGEYLPIKDATRDSPPFELTAMNIRKGKPLDLRSCAKSLACRKAFNSPETVSGSRRTLVLYPKDNHFTRYQNPRRQTLEQTVFDRGGKMEPGVHILKAPRPYDRLGAKRATGPKIKKGKKRSERRAILGSNNSIVPILGTKGRPSKAHSSIRRRSLPRRPSIQSIMAGA